MKWFYEKNQYLLEHEVNKKFEDVLWMTNSEFREWIIELRKTVVYAWDELGIPPRVGYNEEEILEQFNKMTSFPVHEFLVRDELTNEMDIVRNTSVIGNAVNQWFPSMMKTRINYTKDVNKGKSIYDFFAKDELLETFLTYASRHFKRDSFYHYSSPARVLDSSCYGELPVAPNAADWIEQFESHYRKQEIYDYWLESSDESKEYSGYNEKLKGQKYLYIHNSDVDALPIPNKCKTNLNREKSESCRIRVFKLGQKLFPVGLKAFRVSFCQYAVNFPPLTAKYLYERFTKEIENQDQIVIYDPSSGWGGRLLGALSVTDKRTVHYIGTDPNTDHNTTKGRTKYHEFADFFNTRTSRAVGTLFPKTHSYQIFQHGSEEIHKDPDFQKYKGKIDLIFTSPPYFAKEAYSEDEEQSYKKFSQYDSWREGFLRKTLETCVDYLAPNRYLLWNIADAVFDGDMLPLEQDSIDILLSLGMKYEGKLKMSLAQMPGGNRIDTETGLPKAKNFCKVNGIWLKYEPVFIFRK